MKHVIIALYLLLREFRLRTTGRALTSLGEISQNGMGVLYRELCGILTVPLCLFIINLHYETP